MATALPPEEDLPIFDTTVFYDEEGFLTKKTADKLYLKFPVAQGDETLLNAVVAGDLQVNNKINFLNTNSLNIDAYMDYQRTNLGLRLAPTEEGVLIEPIDIPGFTSVGGNLLLRDQSDGETQFNTPNNRIIGRLRFSGHKLNNPVCPIGAYISGVATANFSDTNGSVRMEFYTVPNGSNNASRRLSIGDNGLISMGTSLTPLATLQISKNTIYPENLIIDGSIPAVGGAGSDIPLMALYGNRALGETGRLQILITAVAGNGSTFSEKYDACLRVGAFDDLNRRLILCSGSTGGIVLKNRFTGIQVKDPTVSLDIQNTLATPETVSIDGNNISVSINQYVLKSDPTQGNIQIYSTKTAGNFAAKTEAGDSGIKSDSTHRLHLGSGSFSSIVCQTDGKVGIRPNVSLTDITNTFTVVGINADTTPFSVRTVGTATSSNMNLTCAGPTFSQNTIAGNVNGFTLTPFATVRGVRLAGDVCPSVNNSYDCGAALNYWNTVRGFNAYVQVSDERLKTEIKDLDLGMDFINELRPVSYKWKIGQNKATTEKDESGSFITEPTAGVREHLGLLAQDVGALTKQIGRDLSLWALDDKDDLESGQTLKMAELISPIIKALQDIDKRLKKLESL